MPAIRKSTARVIAVALLLALAAVALREHIQGGEQAPLMRPIGNPALVIMFPLLVVSLAIVASAVIGRVRDRRVAAVAPPDRPIWVRAGGGGTRRRWRAKVLVLLGIAVTFSVFVVIAMLVLPGLGKWRIGELSPGEAPSGETPAHGGTSHADGDPIGYFSLTTAIFLVLLVVGTIVTLRRRPQPAKTGTDSEVHRQPPVREVGSHSLELAAQRGLAEIGDPGREPREAIIACYAAMERELANVPEAVPQDFDTASEVLARGVEHHVLRTDSAAELVSLFTEARFSAHAMNEDDREAAVRALRLILAQLRRAA